MRRAWREAEHRGAINSCTIDPELEGEAEKNRNVTLACQIACSPLRTVSEATCQLEPEGVVGNKALLDRPNENLRCDYGIGGELQNLHEAKREASLNRIVETARSPI